MSAPTRCTCHRAQYLYQTPKHILPPLAEIGLPVIELLGVYAVISLSAIKFLALHANMVFWLPESYLNTGSDQSHHQLYTNIQQADLLACF